MNTEKCSIVGYKATESECKELKSEGFDDCKECKAKQNTQPQPVEREEQRPEREHKPTINPTVSKVRREAKKGVQKSAEESKPLMFETPCCKSCGVKSSDTESFNIKLNICGKCEIAQRPVITLDFSSYPEMHEKVMSLSKGEMRTPEMQVLYLLKKGILLGATVWIQSR